MSKKTNRVLSLMLSVLMVLQLSFGTGIGGMQNVKAQDDLTESQVSQEETVEPMEEESETEPAEEAEDPKDEDQPVEAAAEEAASLKVRVNGIEKDATLLDTTTSYQGKTWTDAEVSYTYEELSENTNLIYLKSGVDGASIEAAKIYSSSTGFDGAFVKEADGWSSGNAVFRSLYPSAENTIIYVIYTAADKTESYIKLRVKKTAQQGIAFLVDYSMQYGESTPGGFNNYQNGFFSGMTGNPAFDFDRMTIYENGKDVTPTSKTLPAYSSETTAFAYKTVD